jgi:hypothetical protein
MSAEEMKEQVAAARESAGEAAGHLQQAENEAEQALGLLEEVAQGTGNDKAENAVANLKSAREKIDEAMGLIKQAMDEAEAYAGIL